MKFLSMFLTAVLALQHLAFAGIETEITEVNRAILSSEEWKPSAADIQKALISIQAFLENPNLGNDWQKDQVKKIRAHGKEYRMQVMGIVRDGRKLVWCSFFPAPRAGEKDRFPEWKEHQILVSDGGFRYWKIEVDPTTDKCTKFSPNGEA